MKKAIEEYAEILSNISEMSTEESNKHLDTIVKGFNLLVEEDILEVVNIVNNLSNNKAVTVDQLILALSKVASLSYANQLTIKKVAERAASIGHTTRETGNSIGNALKGILGRIEGVDIMTTPETYLLLVEAGVSTDGDIFENLASEWHRFDNEQREKIAEKVAGKYHLSKFLAMMNSSAVNQ